MSLWAVNWAPGWQYASGFSLPFRGHIIGDVLEFSRPDPGLTRFDGKNAFPWRSRTQTPSFFLNLFLVVKQSGFCVSD